MTARRTLGELERAVLARLWSDGPADVRAMHAAEHLLGEILRLF